METYFREVRAAGFMQAEDGTKFDIMHSIPDEGGRLLRDMVLDLQPRVIVEIGMALGISTAYIASAIAKLGKPCRYIVIDPFQEKHWKNVGRSMLMRFDLAKYVEFHQDYSHIVLSKLETERTEVEFAFVDGSHLFDYVITDFLLLHRLMPVGGTMIFDDMGWLSVRKAIRFILRNCPYTPLLQESSTVWPWVPGPVEKLKAALGRHLPRALRKYVAPEVCMPNLDMGIRGRFAVLRKTAEDSRGDQERFHKLF